jgi:large subunit ribosomal protein L25
MSDVSFAVEPRSSRGKGAARSLRREGRVPGIVYGGGREATPIALDAAKFERLLERSEAGVNTLIKLTGDSEAAGRTVIAKELQREAVRGQLLHVDLFEVDLQTKIEVSVPIHLVGTPAGVVLGGVLDQQQREVALMCLPNAIPDAIEADVSALELGDSLHVSDLGMPDGTDLVSEGGLTVATVLVPRGLRDSAKNAGADGEGEEGASEGEGDAEGGEG